MSKLRRTALYTYDQQKRLIRIEDEGGVTEYTYDEQGLRTKAQWMTKLDDDELSYADLNALVGSLTKVLAQYAGAKYELEQDLNALVTQYAGEKYELKQEVERLTARIAELEQALASASSAIAQDAQQNWLKTKQEAYMNAKPDPLISTIKFIVRSADQSLPVCRGEDDLAMLEECVTRGWATANEETGDVYYLPTEAGRIVAGRATK